MTNFKNYWYFVINIFRDIERDINESTEKFIKLDDGNVMKFYGYEIKASECSLREEYMTHGHLHSKLKSLQYDRKVR